MRPALGQQASIYQDMSAGYETGGRRRKESNEGSRLLGPAVSTKRHERFDPISTLTSFRNSFGGDCTGLNGTGGTKEDDLVPSLGEIARELQLESSTLTPLVKRLEAAGLVSRHRDVRDERQVRIHLTDAGRQMQERAAHIPACIAEKAGMEPGDLLRVRDEVIALRDRMRRD